MVDSIAQPDPLFMHHAGRRLFRPSCLSPRPPTPPTPLRCAAVSAAAYAISAWGGRRTSERREVEDTVAGTMGTTPESHWVAVPSLFHPAHHAGGGVEPISGSAGEQQCVDAPVHVMVCRRRGDFATARRAAHDANTRAQWTPALRAADDR